MNESAKTTYIIAEPEAPQKAVSSQSVSPTPLSPELLQKMDAWWRAANYLNIGQIYLMANPLLKEPLKAEQIKPRLLGHWGTSPGLNLIYVHLNRLINKYDLDVVYMAGPGHGGPAIVANVYLEGTYTEYFPSITQDEQGMLKLFRQFSTPGGIPSHVSAPTPGSIHEGGELGYVLVHAFGAAFDNPELIVAAVVGDGEAETAPLEGSWKGVKFLNPVRDGAVLPILHLNGYKIAGPTVWGRDSDEHIRDFLTGQGYDASFVEGSDPMQIHQDFAATLEAAILQIREIQAEARKHGFKERPVWPAIVLRTPKGWTGPKVVDGLPIEGTFRAHQVPLANVRDNPEHLKLLEEWMRSYKPQELFDKNGRFETEYAELAPKGERRMGDNPHANGGRVEMPLNLPAFTDYALEVKKPGTTRHESTRQLGQFLRDIYKQNTKPANFRLFCPDETNSNRLGAVFEVTNRCFVGRLIDIDDHVSHDGRVMEVLSEHNCEGWLEGYLLTGRHGLFATYEAFAMVVAAMATQHAKWLEAGAGDSLARAGSLIQRAAHVALLAQRPQRLLASGARVHRCAHLEEGRCRPPLPAARRQHAARRGRSLPAHAQHGESHRHRQAGAASVARPRRRLGARGRGRIRLGMGGHARGERRRPRCRSGLRRRHRDAGDARRSGHAPKARAGPLVPRRECRGHAFTRNRRPPSACAHPRAFSRALHRRRP